jgi:hypothetical protein
VSIAVKKSIFDNFSSLKSGRVPSTTLPSAKTGIRLLNQESAVVTLLVKNFAQKSHFDNFSTKSFGWTGIGKAATVKNLCVPSLHSDCREDPVRKARSSIVRREIFRVTFIITVLIDDWGNTTAKRQVYI